MASLPWPGHTCESVISAAAVVEVVPLTEPQAKARIPSTTPSKIPSRRWVLLAAGLTLFAVLGFWVRYRRLHAEEPIRSLAVLPLNDLSPGAREDYFVDGMTDELVTELARIPGLRVVSRTSVMRDKGTRKPLDQIARELNVDAVVEGSVVRSGNRVRITAQLVDARLDKHLWAQGFEGSLGDVSSMQDSVARQIAQQTSAVLTPAARAELANARHIEPGGDELRPSGQSY